MTPLIEDSKRETRHYRNAVERHWDPAEIGLDQDRKNLIGAYERAIGSDRKGGFDALFDGIRRSLAKFGAGEQSVTEDLAPLAVVIEEQRTGCF